MAFSFSLLSARTYEGSLRGPVVDAPSGQREVRGEELTLIISQKGKANLKLLVIVAYLLYISPLEFGPGS